ncbi:flagellar brake protein [Cupriavidus sp. SZY C1]|uniref:flagellar brake protein n=1 Tax=Cupriavidus sp. SZY C1 TaxID=3055037 RepID=UPI0028BA0381|nr:flagellar brake protein [Cupriavidus sp. SZY C1]MDT6964751.1 flagellar brake protein [Cupriavidus sp. SZY C1]
MADRPAHHNKGLTMRREVQAEEIELGQPLKATLVDELGFPVADEGTVFHAAEERELALHGGRCFWADGEAPLRADMPSTAWHDRYGLLVGTLLHVKRPTDAARAAVSRLIGFNDGAAFIGWPSLAGVAAEIADGEVVLFRGFSGTNIHSFSARVQATSRTPFPYWMLDDIRHIEAREMRGSIRVPVRLVGSLVLSGEQARPQTVLITDLSTGGASISTASPQFETPGQPVRLEFTLRAAGLKQKLSVEGWTRQDPDADAAEPFHNVGVAFDAYGERESLVLYAFVHEQLLESATMRPGVKSPD